ncbi:MAG: hypothetical protein ACKVQU_36655 [Burkholderiales bacterium]
MKRLVVIAVALIAIDSTYAQPLVDPMRPPAGMLATSTGEGTTSALPTAGPARPIVQTIIIGADRRYAVVDGRAVAPGDQVRGMRVVRIAESSVTLREATGKNLEVDLLPGIGKKLSASAAQPERTVTPVRESK